MDRDGRRHGAGKLVGHVADLIESGLRRPLPFIERAKTLNGGGRGGQFFAAFIRQEWDDLLLPLIQFRLPQAEGVCSFSD